MSVSENLRLHPRVDDWLRLAENGRVIVRTGKVDIGQRISTALALIAAEELDVDFSRIEVEGVDTAVSPDEEYTSASNSVERSGNTIRLAAATARRHLLEIAARKLGVNLHTLVIEDGIVRSLLTNRSLSYWEISADRPLNGDVDQHIATKNASDYRLLGNQLITPKDLPDLVRGTAPFVHDMQVLGMLHARLVRPPHYHARILSIDPKIHDRLSGGKLVIDGSFVAVVCEDEYECVKLVERVAGAIKWSSDRKLDTRDLYVRLQQAPRISLPVRHGEALEELVPERSPRPAEAVLTARIRIERPYTMHGAMAPSAALALFENGKLTIWTHTQGVYPLRLAIAEFLGIGLENVRLIQKRGPGIYGHNGADDAALEAALISLRVPEKPILLKWSRADEHAWEPYGPAMIVEVEASIDQQGNVIDWSHETWSDTHRTRPRPGPNKAGPARLISTRYTSNPVPPHVHQPFLSAPAAGIHRNATPYYEFPHTRVVKHLVRDMPLRTSTLRSLGSYANVLAIESAIDQLARDAGLDPLAFRKRHLTDERAHAVLHAVAKASEWAQQHNRPGCGRGLSFARYNNLKAYAAVVVDLEVNDAAEVKLAKIFISVDAGQIVDLDGLTLQIEGAALQAASWTLYEEVTFDENGITSRDWESYPILRFNNVPEIETILINRPGSPFLGPSECAVGPTAAAIANAIYDATGLRLQRLPFRPENIRRAALT